MSFDLPEPTSRAKRGAPEDSKKLVEGVFKEDQFHSKDEERIVLEPIPERQLVDKDGNPEERVYAALNYQMNGWDDIYKHAQMVKIWQDTGAFISVAKEKIENSDDANEKKDLLAQLDWATHQHETTRRWLEMAEQYKTVRQ